MALVLAMLLTARSAEVPTAELAAAVQSMRPRPDAPIAIVTPNRPQQRAVETTLGAADYVFTRAGSPSETELVPLGVTCAVFVTRRGMGARSPWTVTPVGDCGIPLVVDEATPTLSVGPTRVFEHERQYRHGMTIATWGAVGLPSAALVFLVVGYPVGVLESPTAGTVLWGIAAGAAIAAPPTVAFGALSSARALRTSGVPVSRAAGHTALVLMGVAAVAPLLDFDAVAGLCLFSSFVAGGVQMKMDTAAYRASDLEPWRGAVRFHVRPVPLVGDDMRGLALTGAF